MRRPHRARLTRVVLPAVILLAACGPEPASAPPGSRGAPTEGALRAARRAYDGAPPTIPHPDPGAACAACHDADGQSVGERFAPASPHAGAAAEDRTERCRQCHVFVTTDGLFAANRFIGLPQTLRAGSRAAPGAPPTIPHRLLMRERCLACHGGAGGRPEIRTSHPERERCRQCHVPVLDAGRFPPGPDRPAEGG